MSTAKLRRLLVMLLVIFIPLMLVECAINEKKNAYKEQPQSLSFNDRGALKHE